VKLLLCSLAALTIQAAAPVVYYIAPTGSDQGSGKLAAPFATIEHARDVVRSLKHPATPVTVYLRGGTYTLASPLHFTPEDSGASDAPVTYAAYKDERPVISGGRSITGWKETTVDGKHLWTVDIPSVRDGKWYFRELWINGHRATRARNPNTGFFRATAVPDLDLKKPYQQGNESFQFAPGQLEPWPDLDDAEIVFLTFWISAREKVASIDAMSHVAKLARRTPMRLTDGFGQAPQLARFYVENAFELLDAPGEWYLNRKTGSLYYMPLPGEQISKAEAVAPVLEQLVFFDGDPKNDHAIEYLTFRGLTFAHSEWWLPADDRNDKYQRQAASFHPGAIELTGVGHCTFDQCTVAHLSSYAIHFSRGCDHDLVTRCNLLDLGTGGVKIGEPDRIGNVPPNIPNPFPDDPKLETHDIEVSDSVIREGGRVFHQGHGILIGQSYNNLISHNDIRDFYQIGISVGWTWGYGKSLAHDNIIEYNHIQKIGQGWSSDLGGIYTLGPQPGTVLRYNLIHDVECADYVGRGVYLDEGSTGVLVENNIMYNTSTGGFGLNYGRRNIIRNNIFAFGKQAQIEYAGNMAKAPPGSSYTLDRNIFFYRSSENLLRGPWQPRPVDKFTVDHNLYWREGDGELKFGRRTLAEWRGLGFDKESIVADPLFVNAQKGDFHLKPGSPAGKIGFQSIDLSSVGPRRSVR
jgi:hypothetical protein